jgi:hypothetical protein
MAKEIKGFFKEYRWLSNFYLCKVEYEGIVYPSVEHAYQISKAIEKPPENVLNDLLGLSPGKIKNVGRWLPIKSYWESLKVPIMFTLCLIKFSTNKDLKQKLIDTGDAYLEETNTWGDTFWGVCGGVGENHLGDILMTVRRNLP